MTVAGATDDKVDDDCDGTTGDEVDDDGNGATGYDNDDIEMTTYVDVDDNTSSTTSNEGNNHRGRQSQLR